MVKLDPQLVDELATPPLRWHIVPAGAPAPSFDPANRNYLDLLGLPPSCATTESTGF
jgi:hypothetical protein